MRRFILFLIRMKLGVRKYQQFKFHNQKSIDNTYYFTATKVMKMEGCKVRESSVSINWLLDDKCKIIKLKKEV